MRIFELARALNLSTAQPWADEDGITYPPDALLQPDTCYCYQEHPSPIEPSRINRDREPPVPRLHCGGMTQAEDTQESATPDDPTTRKHPVLQTLRELAATQPTRGQESYSTDWDETLQVPYNDWRLNQLALHGPLIAQDEMAYHLQVLQRLRPGHSHVSNPLVWYRGALRPLPTRIAWNRILFTILIDSHWVGVEMAGFDTHWTWGWIGANRHQQERLTPLLSTLAPPHLLDIRHYDIQVPTHQHLCGWTLLQRWYGLLPLNPARLPHWDEWTQTLDTIPRWHTQAADHWLQTLLPQLTTDPVLCHHILALRQRYLLDLQTQPQTPTLLWGGMTTDTESDATSQSRTHHPDSSRSRTPRRRDDLVLSTDPPELGTTVAPYPLEELTHLANLGHVDGHNLRDHYPQDVDWVQWRLTSLVRTHLWLGHDEATATLRILRWLRPNDQHVDGPLIWTGLDFTPHPPLPQTPAFAWLLLMDSHWYAIEGTFQDRYWRFNLIGAKPLQISTAKDLLHQVFPNPESPHVFILAQHTHPEHVCGWSLLHRWYQQLGHTLQEVQGYQTFLEARTGTTGTLMRDAHLTMENKLEEHLDDPILTDFIRHCRQRFVLSLNDGQAIPTIHLGGATCESGPPAPPATQEGGDDGAAPTNPLPGPQRQQLAHTTYRETANSIGVTLPSLERPIWTLWRANVAQQYGAWVGQDEMRHHLAHLRWIHPEIHFAWPCLLQRTQLAP